MNGISEQDCVGYMTQLVIDRTFDGYMTEIQTVYGQLQCELGVAVEPAPDEWDRLYNVDFFIRVGDRFVGLQIKPLNTGIQLAEIHKEYALQAETHGEFAERFGGKVYYVYSLKNGDKREIHNKEVVGEIKSEIKRLENV